MNNIKRLYKRRDNRMLEGVCAGIADYLGVDVTAIRLLWVILTLAGGSGIIAYIAATIIMKDEPVSSDDYYV